MQEMLPQHQIVIPKDEGIEFDPEETGSTFYENSMIKAKTLWNIVHCPVIADDSGICVDALNGAPGIYSARYAGPDFMQGYPDGRKCPQKDQNAFIIQQTNDALKSGKVNVEEGKKTGKFQNGARSAHYVCAMVLYLGNDRFYIANETMEGTLVDTIQEARGNGGFGYDPLFFLPQYGKTSAEITAEEKNAISHRGKALRSLKGIIDSL